MSINLYKLYYEVEAVFCRVLATYGGHRKPQFAHLDLSEQCHEVEAALGRVLATYRGHHKPHLTHLVLSEQCHEGHEVESGLGNLY